jgi:ParB-like chromosome segregation protein Spo0J
MSERQTVTVNVSDLTPHPENFNHHPSAQISELAESLDTFGQFKNIVAWSPNEPIALPDGRKLLPGVRYILAGHGLWLAAMERGLETIEIKDYTGLPYEDALLLMKASNSWLPFSADNWEHQF